MLVINGAAPRYALVPTPSRTEERVMKLLLEDMSERQSYREANGYRYIHVGELEVVGTSLNRSSTKGPDGGLKSSDMSLLIVGDILDVIVVVGGVPCITLDVGAWTSHG